MVVGRAIPSSLCMLSQGILVKAIMQRRIFSGANRQYLYASSYRRAIAAVRGGGSRRQQQIAAAGGRRGGIMYNDINHDSNNTRLYRAFGVAGPRLWPSVRGLSTEPVLANSANPEQPQSPIPKPTADGSEGAPPRVSPKVKKLSDEILALNMLELGDLLKALKHRLGLTDADLRGVAVAAPGAAGAGDAGKAAEEEKPAEKDAFDIKLLSFDDKSKIKVIKEVRAISGLGLKEAKELVEGAPKVVKKDVKKDEAEKLLAKLKEVGAKVELV